MFIDLFIYIYIYIYIHIHIHTYIYTHTYSYGSSHFGSSDLNHFNRPFGQGWAIRAEAPPNNSLLPPPSAFIPNTPLLLRLHLLHLHRLAAGGLPEPLLHFLLCNLHIVMLS